MEQEKKCKNCKFFKMYYILSAGTAYMPIAEGHCANQEIPWKVRKKNLPCDNVCDKWESNEEVKKVRKEKMKGVLKNIHKTLTHIESILNDDF